MEKTPRSTELGPKPKNAGAVTELTQSRVNVENQFPVRALFGVCYLLTVPVNHEWNRIQTSGGSTATLTVPGGSPETTGTQQTLTHISRWHLTDYVSTERGNKVGEHSEQEPGHAQVAATSAER